MPADAMRHASHVFSYVSLLLPLVLEERHAMLAAASAASLLPLLLLAAADFHCLIAITLRCLILRFTPFHAAMMLHAALLLPHTRCCYY